MHAVGADDIARAQPRAVVQRGAGRLIVLRQRHERVRALDAPAQGVQALDVEVDVANAVRLSKAVIKNIKGILSAIK